jgi:8-oxo-dGTP pyrophosphatase MutT (NUDIX family)
MTGHLVVRNSVKLILLNQWNELALLHVDDKNIVDTNGRYDGPFWNMVGGGIETGESILDAAVRELFEETGMDATIVDFGPQVWFGSVDLLLGGKLTTIKQRFLVAKTNAKALDFSHFTENEKSTIMGGKWFSMADIRSSRETIYPRDLQKYLPDILAEIYPNSPIKIRL